MIRRQVVMPVSPERLWAALTDPDQMSGWFGARVEWRLEPGAPARFRGDDGTWRAGRVDAVRPGRHLRFRWWPAEPDADPATGPSGRSDGAEAASEVSFVLEPVPDGTRLTIQERRLDTWPAAGRAEARAGRTETGRNAGWTAWDGFLATAWAGLATPALTGARA